MIRPLPLITAHRACMGHAPENTLAGIDKAIALGADAVEVDVRCTVDAVPVLLHDETVDRTTNGSNALSGMTLAEARRLLAGDARFPEERIPTLEEAAAAAGERIFLVIEIKQEGIEARVVEVVRRLDAVRRCAVHSFLPDAVAAVRRLEPRLPCALLTARIEDPDDAIDAALALNAQGLGVLHGLVDQRLVAAARRRSLRLSCWTVDDPAEVRRLASLGVDGITSDYPDRVRLALSSP
jgi:glycerophosphoryl diester phosphodiesterase